MFQFGQASYHGLCYCSAHLISVHFEFAVSALRLTLSISASSLSFVLFIFIKVVNWQYTVYNIYNIIISFFSTVQRIGYHTIIP